jgi:two-component system phosphate regulon sensor histidine kinase PhoR
LSEVTRNPSIHAAFLAALERGERAEVKIETVDAERRVFDLRVAPLQSGARANGGAARGAIGVFFNITRLERLERVRQEFLSNVSHELRTPLTAIIAFVETLEEGGIDDPANNHRFLAVIRRNAERMHNLIDDILELSAIEAGTVTVEPEPVSLHSLVNDVITTLAVRAAERHIELRNEVSSDTVVHADGRRLEQMITNLVDNAIKFNRDEGIVIVSHETSERLTVSASGTRAKVSRPSTSSVSSNASTALIALARARSAAQVSDLLLSNILRARTVAKQPSAPHPDKVRRLPSNCLQYRHVERCRTHSFNSTTLPIDSLFR